MLKINDNMVNADTWDFEAFLREWAKSLTADDLRTFDASEWDVIEMPMCFGRCIGVTEATFDLGNGYTVEAHVCTHSLDGFSVNFDEVATPTGDCGEFEIKIDQERMPGYETQTFRLYKDGHEIDNYCFDDEEFLEETLQNATNGDELTHDVSFPPLREIYLDANDGHNVLTLHKDVNVWLDFNKPCYIHS